MIVTVAKRPNGKADVPTGTNYRVVSEDKDALTIEVPDPDPMTAVLAAVAALGPEALLGAIGVAGGLIGARSTFAAAQVASATTAARSVAAALTVAADAGIAATEEADARKDPS